MSRDSGPDGATNLERERQIQEKIKGIGENPDEKRSDEEIRKQAEEELEKNIRVEK